MGQSFSDWLNSIRFSPSERSPYWSEHKDGKGFYNASVQDGKVHNWHDSGFNRARGTSSRYLDAILGKANFDKEGYQFSCVKTATFVTGGAYDPDNMFLKLTFKNSRNGNRGGIPTGDTTIYDHVPPNVFAYLKSVAESKGHVGREVWDILRVRGFTQQSKYPYTNREG